MAPVLKGVPTLYPHKKKVRATKAELTSNTTKTPSSPNSMIPDNKWKVKKQQNLGLEKYSKKDPNFLNEP